jgi:hypothetical protein
VRVHLLQYARQGDVVGDTVREMQRKRVCERESKKRDRTYNEERDMSLKKER